MDGGRQQTVFLLVGLIFQLVIALSNVPVGFFQLARLVGMLLEHLCRLEEQVQRLMIIRNAGAAHSGAAKVFAYP